MCDLTISNFSQFLLQYLIHGFYMLVSRWTPIHSNMHMKPQMEYRLKSKVSWNKLALKPASQHKANTGEYRHRIHKKHTNLANEYIINVWTSNNSNTAIHLQRESKSKSVLSPTKMVWMLKENSFINCYQIQFILMFFHQNNSLSNFQVSNRKAVICPLHLQCQKTYKGKS